RTPLTRSVRSAISGVSADAMPMTPTAAAAHASSDSALGSFERTDGRVALLAAGPVQRVDGIARAGAHAAAALGHASAHVRRRGPAAVDALADLLAAVAARLAALRRRVGRLRHRACGRLRGDHLGG